MSSSKTLISPFLLGLFVYVRSSLRLQTFLSFRTLHLEYPKLVGTPCNRMTVFKFNIGQILIVSNTFAGTTFEDYWPAKGSIEPVHHSQRVSAGNWTQNQSQSYLKTNSQTNLPRPHTVTTVLLSIQQPWRPHMLSK